MVLENSGTTAARKYSDKISPSKAENDRARKKKSQQIITKKRINHLLQRSAVSDEVFLHMLRIDPAIVSSTTASPAIECLNQITINESSFIILSYKNNPNLQANVYGLVLI